jgi:hypothetical protein
MRLPHAHPGWWLLDLVVVCAGSQSGLSHNQHRKSWIARGDTEALWLLAGHVIARHYPEAETAQSPTAR